MTDRRVRAGRAFDVRSILDELAAPMTRQAERRDLVLELALTAPHLPRLEPETWVARQRADIQTARDALAQR